MAQYAAELFLHFVYSQDLSYHELLEREDTLKTSLGEALHAHSGEAIHFEALGDTLRGQCVFKTYDEDLFHNLCEAIVHETDNTVEGRCLFVSKDLAALHLYTLSGGQWREAVFTLPLAGPFGQALFEF